MTPLGKLTHVAVVLPARTSDWEACVNCGERMDFETTDGMGRIIPQCPVCDWGWRHSNDYAAYRQRAAQIVTPPDPVQGGGVKVYTPRACTVCSTTYTPRTTSQRYCSDACKTIAKRDAAEALRAARIIEYAQAIQLRGDAA